MGTSGFSSTKESNGSKKQRNFFTNQHEMTITHAVTFDQTVNVSYISQGNILHSSNMPYLRIKLNITIIVHLYFNEHYIFHQDIL